MQKAPRLLRAALVLLALPVGAVVLYLLAALTTHRYDNSGFGYYRGAFHVQLFHAGADRELHVLLEGETPRRWCWTHPTNYRYSSLDLTWGGDVPTGQGVIDVASRTLSIADEQSPLSIEAMASLFFGEPFAGLEPQAVEALESVERMVDEAGAGKLPRPRHHSYGVDGAMEGRLVHFSLGSRYPYSLYCWIAAWCAAVVWMMARAVLSQATRATLRDATGAPR